MLLRIFLKAGCPSRRPANNVKAMNEQQNQNAAIVDFLAFYRDRTIILHIPLEHEGCVLDLRVKFTVRTQTLCKESYSGVPRIIQRRGWESPRTRRRRCRGDKKWGRGMVLPRRLGGLAERLELPQPGTGRTQNTSDEMQIRYCHEKFCKVNHEFVLKMIFKL